MSSKQVELARATIEKYIKEDKIIAVPKDLPDDLKKKAGVFVSIHKGSGDLRGCIGTFLPTTNSIAEEIIRNAIEASTRDPRFAPIEESELNDLDISVDVLSEPASVTDIKELNAKKYGIIVSSRGRRGLLLPDLEGVDTPAQQISICRQKAWINETDPITIEKFEVRRFH
jgi:AmmeMemoRadiSam system protein A